MAEICEVTATTLLQSNLYEPDIAGSGVFKSKTFRKFIKAAISYTKKVEDNNKTVLAVLETVR